MRSDTHVRRDGASQWRECGWHEKKQNRFKVRHGRRPILLLKLDETREIVRPPEVRKRRTALSNTRGVRKRFKCGRDRDIGTVKERENWHSLACSLPAKKCKYFIRIIIR